MLELNLTAYGYGLGLVLASWFAGMVVGHVLNLVSISKIF
jgi:hypothetical protein